MAVNLEIRELYSGYDDSHVLNGLDLSVSAGQISAVLGRNGVGKSTMVNTVMGLVPASSGSILINGAEMVGKATDAIARAGVGLVPQGRRVFAPLTVNENLMIAERHGGRGPWTQRSVLNTLPLLARRSGNRGDQLSGGEQQMLAIARALLTNPSVLLLDEPSDGLAPAVVAEVAEVISRLADEGMTVLLVEQDVQMALSIAESVAVMEKGQVVRVSSAQELRADSTAIRTHLGLG